MNYVTREDVVKAMAIIREWCESRDALEEACADCPMVDACNWDRSPCSWEVEE